MERAIIDQVKAPLAVLPLVLSVEAYAQTNGPAQIVPTSEGLFLKCPSCKVERTSPEGPWLPVISSRSGTSADFNYQSTADENGYRKAWIRYTDRSKGRVIKRVLAYEAFDCAGDRSMTITMTEYQNGRVANSTTAVPDVLIPQMMQPIVPESVGEALKLAVCTGHAYKS